MSEEKEETLPYIQITQINDFIKKFPKTKIKLDDLHQIFGKSKVSNLVPTLELLNLIDYNKRERIISLSEFGRKYRTSLITDSLDDAANILIPKIEKIESMKYIRNLLDAKDILTSEEIGKQLAFKYSKNWTNPRSFKIYGAAIASVLGFCNFGTYSRGVLRKGVKMSINERKPVLPSASFNKIFKITRAVFNLKKVDLETLINEFGKRVSSDLAPCIELGLVERVAPKLYQITPKGEELVYEMNQEFTHENWQQILYDSNYWRYISLLEGKEISTSILGDFLNKHLGGKWSSKNTAITYAKKFLTWLNNASLLEKIGQGKYLLKTTYLHKEESEKTLVKKELEEKIVDTASQNMEIKTETLIRQTKLSEPKSQLNLRLFHLGKSIGVIKSSSSKDLDEVSQAVKFIMNFCKKNQLFMELIELFEEHLELFQEIKDPRIFFPDINLLEKKLETSG